MTAKSESRNETPIDYDANMRRAWYDRARVLVAEMSGYEKTRRPIMYEIAFDNMEALLRAYVQAYEAAYFHDTVSETKCSTEIAAICQLDGCRELRTETGDKA